MTEQTGGAVPQTLTQWWRFVTSHPSQPTRISRTAYDKLSPTDRESYDAARQDWLAVSHVIDTPQLKQIREDTRRVVRRQTSTTPAFRNTQYIIVSGEPTVGKTITATRVGLEHERARRSARRCQECPDCDRPDPGCSCPRCVEHVDDIDAKFAPVIYIEVPEAASAKRLMRRICDFAGALPKRSADTDDLTTLAARTLTELGTSLVILDEIQNLAPKSTTGAETATALKRFSGVMPAAFMYVGVNLAGDKTIVGGDGLFTGDTGKMIAGRARFTEITRFPYSTKAHKQDWDAVVNSFEQTLPLLDQKQGTLATNHAELLWHLTGGSLNTLWTLLSEAALDAIDDGTERINKGRLKIDVLDQDAQERFRRRNEPK